MDKKVREYREKLAEAFLKSIEESPRTWQQDWRSPQGRPHNAVTGAAYRGINRIWLSYQQQAQGFSDPRWCTFNQLKAKGWHLEKGSKGVQIEYWMPYDTQEKKCITWKEYEEREEKEHIALRAKYFYVFNGCQIEGIPELEKEEETEINQALVLETISKNMGVEILHDGSDSAFYRPSEDKIHLPEKQAFLSTYGYNATVLHELSHATGHRERLNRDLSGSFGSEAYAYEELVAEFSSCFMSENLPVEMDAQHYENHKAYIGSWAAGVKKNPEVLVKAVRDAERAADYLELQAEIGLQRSQEKQRQASMEIEEKDVVDTGKGLSMGVSPLSAGLPPLSTGANAMTEDDRIIAMLKKKAYVRSYIREFFESYDFDHPMAVQGSMLPSCMMEKDLLRGGMGDTKAECLEWVYMDPEAAENTAIYIKDKYPELSGMTPESDPGRFSLLMMEREIYKMVYEADVVDENWDGTFLLDRAAAREICEAAGINPTEGSLGKDFVLDYDLE